MGRERGQHGRMDPNGQQFLHGLARAFQRDVRQLQTGPIEKCRHGHMGHTAMTR